MVKRDDAVRMDRDDPLAPFRARFDLPDGIIYLDGNSLGPLLRAMRDRLDRVRDEEWGISLIRAWNEHHWFTLPQTVGDKIARLIGGGSGNVVAADTTSVNLFKMLSAALQLRPDRPVILSDSGNFPTDLYIAEGVAGMAGGDRRLRIVEPETVAEAIDDEVAVVMLTEVDYRTGRRHDMGEITARAHAAGALALWDLSHSAGAFPVDLLGADADFAVGCGYKYLNGGPGAPAFLFAHPRHQQAIRPPLSGWWGHEAPFAFDKDYRPAEGIARQLCGTQPILSFAALDEALDFWSEVDIATLREKSVRLCELFISAVDRFADAFGLTLASPRDPKVRGSQVSWRHEDGYAVMQALIARGVIGDFRAPDIIRFGFAPLYIRYVDVWNAAAALQDVLATKAYLNPEYRRRAAVT